MLRIALIKYISELCTMQNKIVNERREAANFFSKIEGYIGSREQAPAERKRAVTVWLSGIGELTPVVTETLLRLAANRNDDTEELRSIMSARLARKKYYG